MEDRRVGVRIVTVRIQKHFINNYLFQLSEEEEKTEKKGLDKPYSRGNKKGKGDSDDDDEDDIPSIFKRKSPLHVQSLRKSQRRSSRVVVDEDDDDDDDDVFTKTLSKMKDTRGRSNIGLKRTSFSSYGQNPHPGSRKKQFLSEYFFMFDTN